MGNASVGSVAKNKNGQRHLTFSTSETYVYSMCLWIWTHVCIGSPGSPVSPVSWYWYLYLWTRVGMDPVICTDVLVDKTETEAAPKGLSQLSKHRSGLRVITDDKTGDWGPGSGPKPEPVGRHPRLDSKHTPSTFYTSAHVLPNAL